MTVEKIVRISVYLFHHTEVLFYVRAFKSTRMYLEVKEQTAL